MHGPVEGVKLHHFGWSTALCYISIGRATGLGVVCSKSVHIGTFACRMQDIKYGEYYWKRRIVGTSNSVVRNCMCVLNIYSDFSQRWPTISMILAVIRVTPTPHSAHRAQQSPTTYILGRGRLRSSLEIIPKGGTSPEPVLTEQVWWIFGGFFWSMKCRGDMLCFTLHFMYCHGLFFFLMLILQFLWNISFPP